MIGYIRKGYIYSWDSQPSYKLNTTLSTHITTSFQYYSSTSFKTAYPNILSSYLKMQFSILLVMAAGASTTLAAVSHSAVHYIIL